MPDRKIRSLIFLSGVFYSALFSAGKKIKSCGFDLNH